jgi:adenosine deaminase
VALVTDLIRDHGPEQAGRVLAAVQEARGYGIVGVGIGGSEQEFPPEAFTGVYARARDLGLHTSAHAGEAAGPASVWGAIRALEVERIGHGTRAVEDSELVEYLAQHHIPVELCPMSNLRTGVISSIADHPARIYFARGIPLSINTDDPKMFNTSLAEEYLALERNLGFSPAEIAAIILQSIEISWLSDPRKQQLRRQFQGEFANLA